MTGKTRTQFRWNRTDGGGYTATVRASGRGGRYFTYRVVRNGRVWRWEGENGGGPADTAREAKAAAEAHCDALIANTGPRSPSAGQPALEFTTTNDDDGVVFHPDRPCPCPGLYQRCHGAQAEFTGGRWWRCRACGMVYYETRREATA